MILFLFSSLFAMDHFLTYFPGSSSIYKGVDQNGGPCEFSVLDVSDIDKQQTNFIGYQVTLAVSEYPFYKFIVYYENSNPNVKVRQISENKYFINWQGTSGDFSSFYFTYTNKYIEIERQGYASHGPLVSCRIN